MPKKYHRTSSDKENPNIRRAYRKLEHDVERILETESFYTADSPTTVLVETGSKSEDYAEEMGLGILYEEGDLLGDDELQGEEVLSSEDLAELTNNIQKHALKRRPDLRELFRQQKRNSSLRGIVDEFC